MTRTEGMREGRPDATRPDATRRVALLSYHFPPMASPGSLRVSSFARNLAEYGWTPTVFSAGDIGYPKTDLESLEHLPKDLETHRLFGWLASGHWALRRQGDRSNAPSPLRRLGLKVIYRIASLPDHAAMWHVAMGLAAGRRLRRDGTDVLITSSPPASSILAGAVASRFARVRWIVDLRDPPPDVESSRGGLGGQRLALKWSWKLLGRADGILTTTSLAGRRVSERFPKMRVATVPNGYDGAAIARARSAVTHRSAPAERTIVHAGALYPGSRDIGPFLNALCRAQQRVAEGLQFRLSLPGPPSLAIPSLPDTDPQPAVDLPGFLSHSRTLETLAAADLLLLIQGPGFETQIPSKVYEYLALGRPVLALTPAGATAELLDAAPQATVFSPDEEAGLETWLVDWAEGRLSIPESTDRTPGVLSREEVTACLASVLDRWVDSG